MEEPALHVHEHGLGARYLADAAVSLPPVDIEVRVPNPSDYSTEIAIGNSGQLGQMSQAQDWRDAMCKQSRANNARTGDNLRGMPLREALCDVEMRGRVSHLL